MQINDTPISAEDIHRALPNIQTELIQWCSFWNESSVKKFFSDETMFSLFSELLKKTLGLQEHDIHYSYIQSFLKISNALYIQICLHSVWYTVQWSAASTHSLSFWVWCEVKCKNSQNSVSPPPTFFFIFIGGIELTSLFKTLKHKSTQHLILQAESNRQKWKDSKDLQDHALLYADECFPFAELMSQPHPSSVSSSSDIVFILLKAYNTL